MEEVKMDNKYLWDLLLAHAGNKVSIATWCDANGIVNVSLVDDDRDEIIIDAELYTLAARTDIK